MSEDVTLDDFKTLNVNYYLSLVAFTILVQEYCLTFVDEVELFWKVGQLNWASGLFCLNRYLVLFGHIPVMIEYFWSTNNPSKVQLQAYHQYFAVVIQIIVSSMLIMRMYALYNQRKVVLVALVGVSILAVGIGCVSLFPLLAIFRNTWRLGDNWRQKTKQVEILIPIGCGAMLTHAKALRLGGAWASMLLFDILVFGMTVYKSIFSPRTRGISLITVLLRDGAVYFSIMILSNLSNILTFFYGGPFTRGVVTTLTNIISSVMISRLMLNLRHPSLVCHSSSTFAWNATVTENTNLTFIDAYYNTRDSSHSTDAREIDSQAHVGRARSMYAYLANGSSAPERDVNSSGREAR